MKPVRAVSFSPGGKLLAAAGDSKVIVLYDTSSGEQVANLSGHSAWIMSLAWSQTGEYLLSGSVANALFNSGHELTSVPDRLMEKSRSGQSIPSYVWPHTPRPRKHSGASSGSPRQEKQKGLQPPEPTAVCPSTGRQLEVEKNRLHLTKSMDMTDCA